MAGRRPGHPNFSQNYRPDAQTWITCMWVLPLVV